MTSSEPAYFRHSLPRQASICCHHFSIGAGLASARARSYWALRSASTSLTLPTMGTSTRTRLEIDEGSMSMWMILRAFCAKWRGLPMTRSSKRAPMASSTSQCCIAMFAS
ncbi:Uncharacterised protein [Bordetella pertussis]|nr:Uncharacterised protein [Bordetella pertussis]